MSIVCCCFFNLIFALFLFLFISHYLKKKLSTNPVHERSSMDPVQSGGPWTPGPCFVLTPIILVIITLNLFRLNRWGESGEREDDYTVFQYFFQSKRNVKMYLWDVIIQTISRGIFNSIVYCSYSRNYLILTSNSLPADVLWGSFVTHSFSPTVPLPHGPWRRNECATSEPQRTSAGRLDE